MREFAASAGKVRVDVDEGRVGITAVTAFGDGTRVRAHPEEAAEIARAIGLAVVEALPDSQANKDRIEIKGEVVTTENATTERHAAESLTFDSVDQQIRLHALNVAIGSRQAIWPAAAASSKFAEVVLEDAAKYEAFLRG